ncbi:MAG: cupin domain-containing protein [Bacteroidaceae bacterium]|nr:cupin domain-containing protein [Bacteroidaceae bacterium]
MAVIFKKEERVFKENPGKIDKFRLLTDISRTQKGVNPEYLNFDVRLLNPGQYCAAYHFHRYAEELFLILSGKATLRTPQGLKEVESGDIIFFEKGAEGAHQLYNHTSEPCTYLDIRTYIGYDICEYPDSDKIYVVPGGEILRKSDTLEYFDGEEKVNEKWEEIKKGKL